MARRNDLMAKRDKAIVDKFYELYDKQRKRMDDVLDELSNKHFFLDANYIYSRIFYNKDNNAYYESLLTKNNQHQKH